MIRYGGLACCLTLVLLTVAAGERPDPVFTGILHSVEGTLFWVLSLVAAGWAVFPAVRRMAGRLPDQGWFLSRWLGLNAICWFAWVLSLFGWAEFPKGGILAGLAVVAIASMAAGLRHPTPVVSPSAWRWIRNGELLFWAVFGGLLLIRILNPDLRHPHFGGEKPMELAILNSLLVNPDLPPTDPWLAGETINYYYFGFLPMAVLALWGGLPAAAGFNLAVPTLAALAAIGSTMAVAVLSRPAADVKGNPDTEGPVPWRRRNLWAPLLLMGIGNLHQVRLVAQGFRQMGDADGATGLPIAERAAEVVRGAWNWASGTADWPFSTASWYWSATRIYPAGPGEAAPFAEFPLFSFIFADLHPHLMALPAGLFLILLLAVWARECLPQWHAQSPGFGQDLGRAAPKDAIKGWGMLALAGSVLGIAVLTSPWDFPLGVGLVLGSVALSLKGRSWSSSAVRVGLTLGVAVLVMTPFLFTYTAPVGGLQIWRGSQTPLTPFLWHFGLPLTVSGMVLWSLRSRIADGLQLSWRGRSLDPTSVLLGLVLVLAVARWTGLISGAGWVCLLLCGLAAPLLRAGSLGRERAVGGLLVLGCVLGLVPEHLALAGDTGRMNLVFKLHFQVWVLWSLAGASLLAAGPGPALSSLRRPLLPLRFQRLSFGALLASSLLYPLTAIPARILDRAPGATGIGLNGLGSLAGAEFPWAGGRLRATPELEAVRWLLQDAVEAEVLLEAVTDDYGAGGRISSATGLPTVLGWPAHQLQQRRRIGLAAEIHRRRGDVRRIYTAETPEEVLPLLRKYRVRYVVVGELEGLEYGAAGLSKFEGDAGRHWDVGFRSSGMTIYRLRDCSD